MSSDFKEAFKRGTSTFEAFLAPLQSRGTGFALRILGKREDAEDVVSEANWGLFRASHRHALDERGAYLCYWTILRRKTVSLLRRRPKCTLQLDSQQVFGADELPDRNARTASRLYQEREALWRRAAIIRTLPRGMQRRVAFLHQIRGMTTSEIALRLGCTPGSAASHWHRALKNLRANHPDFAVEKHRHPGSESEA
jgi:RNA polymerase sigma factor (sigma-70 family)